MQSQPKPDWVTKGNKFALHLHFSIQMYWSHTHTHTHYLLSFFWHSPFSAPGLRQREHTWHWQDWRKSLSLTHHAGSCIHIRSRNSEPRFHIRKLQRGNVMIWNFQRMPDIWVLVIKPHQLLPAHAGPSWWQFLSPPHRCGWWLWQPQPAPGHALPVAARCAAASPSVPPGELWCQRFFGHIEKRSLSAGRRVKKRKG